MDFFFYPGLLENYLHNCEFILSLCKHQGEGGKLANLLPNLKSIGIS